jgi:cytochrome c553
MQNTSRRPVLVALTAVAVSSVLACSGGPRAGSSSNYQMWLHFEQAGRIQSAMIQGDLPTARRAARALASQPTAAGIGPEGAAQVEELSMWARTIRDAPSFGDAAEATGFLAATCGDCHASSGVGPAFRPSDPPEDRGFTGHMILHAWAADRMWEGLIAASPDAWTQGAAVFVEEALGHEVLTPSAEIWAERLHALGREAVGETDRKAQADLYGRILQQCSGCHAEVGLDQ